MCRNASLIDKILFALAMGRAMAQRFYYYFQKILLLFSKDCTISIFNTREISPPLFQSLKCLNGMSCLQDYLLIRIVILAFQLIKPQ